MLTMMIGMVMFTADASGGGGGETHVPADFTGEVDQPSADLSGVEIEDDDEDEDDEDEDEDDFDDDDEDGEDGDSACYREAFTPNPFPQGTTVQIAAGPWAGEVGTVNIAKEDKAKVIWPGCPRNSPDYWGVWVMHSELVKVDPATGLPVVAEAPAEDGSAETAAS